MTISDLISIARPPTHAHSAVLPEQWNAVEKELGTELPGDYKQFWMQYGDVQFFEYLQLFNPLHLRYGLIGRQNEFAEWYSNQDRFPVWPTPSGLLNIGSDEDSHHLFWVTKGVPDDWQIVYFDDNLLMYEFYPFSLTSFLVGFVLGNVHPSFVRRNLRERGIPAVSQIEA